MSDESDALAAFGRLLETTAAQPGVDNSPVLLTDGLVGPAVGAVLRRCAVPHEFDRALLQRLGGYSDAEAAERYAEFTELSAIQINADALCVHERWRRSLWRWWLDDAQRAEFVALNETLVAWFGGGDETAARRRMFHLIGCRQDEGLQAFEVLFRSARHRRRFSECSLLLRLAHEYDPLLEPAERALLTYHEGKLASDLREWERSLALLQAVANDETAEVGLRVNAEVRAGHVLRQLGRPLEALAVFEKAIGRVAAEPSIARSEWRVLYEMGEVLRDLRRFDEAGATLVLALASANDDDDEDADLPGVLNSLGTVQLKLGEYDSAIDNFRTSLDRLKQRGDAVRSGAVLNNLGLAQLERGDWQAAEQSLAESLETKRAAGDPLGQATTLLNLSRVQVAQKHMDDACRSAEQAAALYEAGGDALGHTRARLATARLLRRSERRAESAALLQAMIAQAQAAKDEATAATARAELALSGPRRGIPWWGWTLIVLALLVGLLLIAAIVIALAVASGEDN